MSQYLISIEPFEDVANEFLVSMMQQHYQEMVDRLNKDGIKTDPCNLQVESYIEYSKAGGLLTYVLRKDQTPVGYANIYLTESMHTGKLIACEDALYVIPEERNGIGKKMVTFILEDLRGRGIKNVTVSAMTDLRVAKMWKRMGFKEIAVQMQYTF